MNITSMIEFKSVPENYEKENVSIKPNTVRIVDEDDDYNITNFLDNLEWIKISEIDGDISHKYFVRRLKDITRFESHGLIIYIFSW